MRRSVAAHLEFDLDDPAELLLSVAVAVERGSEPGVERESEPGVERESEPGVERGSEPGVERGSGPGTGADVVSESLLVSAGGTSLEPIELLAPHGTRIHRVLGERGTITVDYRAEVAGQATPEPVDEVDLIAYRRPSRYCESDKLMPTAVAEFSGLEGVAALDAVSTWVHDRLAYVPEASRPIDGAAATLLAREGVCRDYAHLVIALLRGLDVPARLAAVYAPGLHPMDFHAVAEAYVDGAWHVVDATRLAPRESMLRIATGQDAAGTSFLTSHGGNLDLRAIEVTAIVDVLPYDDASGLVQLG